MSEHQHNDPPEYGALYAVNNPENQIPPILNPTNDLVRWITSGKITAQYVLDPDLLIPENIESIPPEEEDYHANLEIVCFNGNADIRVWIYPGLALSGEVTNNNEKASILVESLNGRATLRIHDVYHLHPLSVLCISSAETSLYIPRSFTGPIIANAVKGLVFSPEVSKNLTLVSQVNARYHAFIGNMALYRGHSSIWEGDSAYVDTQDRATIYYDDEGCPDPAPSHSSPYRNHPPRYQAEHA